MVLKSIFNKRRQKRANVFFDSFGFFLALIVFIVIAVTGSYILSTVNTDIQADADFNNETKLIMSNLNTGYPIWFDYGAGAVLILLWIMVLVASFYLDTAPIFFMVSVIVLMIVIFAINAFMEAITDYFADDDIAPVVELFPISLFITNNIEKIIAAIGFSIAIATYGKYRA